MQACLCTFELQEQLLTKTPCVSSGLLQDALWDPIRLGVSPRRPVCGAAPLRLPLACVEASSCMTFCTDALLVCRLALDRAVDAGGCGCIVCFHNHLQGKPSQTASGVQLVDSRMPTPSMPPFAVCGAEASGWGWLSGCSPVWGHSHDHCIAREESRPHRLRHGYQRWGRKAENTRAGAQLWAPLLGTGGVQQTAAPADAE